MSPPEIESLGAPRGSPVRAVHADRFLQLALAALCVGLAVAAAGPGPPALAWVVGGGVGILHASGRAPRAAAWLALGLAGAVLGAPRPPVALALALGVCAVVRLVLLRAPTGAWLGGVRRLCRQRRTALLATGLCAERDAVRAGDHYEDAGRVRHQLRDQGVARGRGDVWLQLGVLAARPLAALPGDAVAALLACLGRAPKGRPPV